MVVMEKFKIGFYGDISYWFLWRNLKSVLMEIGERLKSNQMLIDLESSQTAVFYTLGLFYGFDGPVKRT